MTCGTRPSTADSIELGFNIRARAESVQDDATRAQLIEQLNDSRSFLSQGPSRGDTRRNIIETVQDMWPGTPEKAIRDVWKVLVEYKEVLRDDDASHRLGDAVWRRSPAASSPNASLEGSACTPWTAPPGYVSVSDIQHDPKFSKNGKNPPRTTIDYWMKTREHEGSPVKSVKAPDNNEVHLPVSWVEECLLHWNPRP